VINEEYVVEYGPLEAPCSSPKDDKAIEYFVALPQEEKNDEEYSHASIEN
jgi:hypothetical protein